MKSTSELRSFLSGQMTGLANGGKDVKKAKAICNYAAQIYNTLSLDVKVEQMRRKAADMPIKSMKFPTEDGK